MPGFICEECGAIENTACGFYWARTLCAFDAEHSHLNGKALCYDCCPNTFSDGSRVNKWRSRMNNAIEYYDGTQKGLINEDEFKQKRLTKG